MADSDIRKIAMQAVVDLFTDNGVDLSELVAGENSRFNADGKDEWFRVFYSGGTPEPVTLGLGGSDRLEGFIQIDLNKEKNGGVKFFDTWLDLIRAKFFAGKSFTNGSSTLIIQSVGMSGGRVFENWFRKSITIAFRADLIRNSTP